MNIVEVVIRTRDEAKTGLKAVEDSYKAAGARSGKGFADSFRSHFSGSRGLIGKLFGSSNLEGDAEQEGRKIGSGLARGIADGLKRFVGHGTVHAKKGVAGSPGSGLMGLLEGFGNLVPGLAGTSGGASGFGALASTGGSLFTNPYAIGAGVLAAPFAAQMLSGGLVTGLGGGLAGLGILGALGSGKTVTPQQMQAAQLRLTAAQDRLAKAQAGTPAHLNRHGQLVGGKAPSPGSIASAQAGVLSAQTNLKQLQDNQQSPQQLALRNQFKTLSSDAQDSLAQIGKSFIPVMQSIFTTADSVLKKMTPIFAAAEKVIAGPFQKFADALIKAFDQPAVSASIKAVANAFGLILKALTPQLAGDARLFANAITAIANNVAKNPQAFADFIGFLVHVVTYALDAVNGLTVFANYVEQRLPGEVAAGLKNVRNWFNDFVRFFRDLWHAVPAPVRDAVAVIGRVIQVTWKAIWSDTKAVWAAITGVLKVAWDVIAGLFKFVLALLTGNWKAAHNAMRNAAVQVWNAIRGSVIGIVKNLVAGVMTEVRSLPSLIMRFFADAGSWLFNAGKNLVMGFIHGIGSMGGSVLSTVGHYLNPMNFFHFAQGGTVGAATGGPRSGLVMVGEHGRELVRLPAGSTVRSNPDTEAALAGGYGAGGGLVLSIDSAGSSAFEQFMVQAIREWVRVKGGGDVQRAFGRH